MLVSDLPANAKSIHRRADLGLGVFYTVPADKTLYVTCAWCSMIPNSATGSSMGFGVWEELSGNFHNLVIASSPIGATDPIFIRNASVAQRVEGGQQLTITDAGGALSLTVGFIGWLY